MSYLFDLTGERLTGVFDSTYAVDASNSLTLGLWAKKTGAEWDLNNCGAMMISEDPLDRSPGAVMMFHRTANDQVSVGRYDSADASSYANNNMDTPGEWDDEWVPVIITLVDDSDASVYLQDSNDTAQSTGTRVLGTALDSIMVGNVSTGLGSEFNGLIAEACVWNKALSTDEIDELWTSSNTGPRINTIAPGNVIGYWPLDADNSTQSNLGSDTGGDLTVTNATFDSDHPTVVDPAIFPYHSIKQRRKSMQTLLTM